MRRFITVFMLFASLFATSCHEATTNVRHIHDNPYRDWPVVKPIFTTFCATALCDRVIYVSANCIVTDGTHALTQIDVLVGTHLCIYNQSGCDMTVKFDARLFGKSAYDIPKDGCINLTVGSSARGQTYTTEFLCGDCSDGGGHTNPDVKVGDDEEP